MSDPWKDIDDATEAVREMVNALEDRMQAVCREYGTRMTIHTESQKDFTTGKVEPKIVLNIWKKL